jgi:hypothetical protein
MQTDTANNETTETADERLANWVGGGSIETLRKMGQ